MQTSHLTTTKTSAPIYILNFLKLEASLWEHAVSTVSNAVTAYTPEEFLLHKGADFAGYLQENLLSCTIHISFQDTDLHGNPLHPTLSFDLVMTSKDTTRITGRCSTSAGAQYLEIFWSKLLASIPPEQKSSPTRPPYSLPFPLSSLIKLGNPTGSDHEELDETAAFALDDWLTHRSCRFASVASTSAKIIPWIYYELNHHPLLSCQTRPYGQRSQSVDDLVLNEFCPQQHALFMNQRDEFEKWVKDIQRVYIQAPQQSASGIILLTLIPVTDQTTLIEASSMGSAIRPAFDWLWSNILHTFPLSQHSASLPSSSDQSPFPQSRQFQPARGLPRRPRHPEDEWARVQIWQLHAPKDETYTKWRQMLPEDRPLEDPRDTFRKLIQKPPSPQTTRTL